MPPHTHIHTGRHLPYIMQEVKREGPSLVHSRNIVPLALIREFSMGARPSGPETALTSRTFHQLLSDSTPFEDFCMFFTGGHPTCLLVCASSHDDPPT